MYNVLSKEEYIYEKLAWLWNTFCSEKWSISKHLILVNFEVFHLSIWEFVYFLNNALRNVRALCDYIM